MIIKQKFREAKNMPRSAMENYISYMEAGSSSLLENPRNIRDDGNVEYQFNKMVELNNVSQESITNDFYEQPLLFSREGEDIRELKKSLFKAEGNIWIPIISLKESEALQAGLDSQIKFRQKGRQFVEMFSEAANIPMSNLNYMAVMHQLEPEHQKTNKDSGAQPHLHFIIWEKEPLQKRGNIDKERLLVLVENTKDLFIKEKLTQIERDSIEFGEDVTLGADISRLIMDVSIATNSVKQPTVDSIRDDIKKLHKKSEYIKDLISNDIDVVENEVELILLDEDIRTLVASMSEINSISEKINTSGDKRNTDLISNILLSSSSEKYRNNYLDKIISSIPYAEISPIESKNPVLELSLMINNDINTILPMVSEGVFELDPKVIDSLANNMIMLQSLKSVELGKNLSAYAEFNRVLSNKNNLDQLIDIIEKQNVDLNVDSVNILRDFSETIDLVNSLSSNRLSYPELKAEIVLLENLASKKFSEDYVAPIISGLQITFVEQYELMNDLINKMSVEYRDNDIALDSISTLKETLKRISPDVERLKNSLTLEEKELLNEQKDRHLSIKGSTLDIFKESQPEFKAREWSLIEIKWLLEDNINLINSVSPFDEKIAELRHFNFNKDYERVSFDKQVGSRVSQIENILINSEGNIDSATRDSISQKNILVKDLVNIQVNNEDVLSSLKLSESKREISGLSNYISREIYELELSDINKNSDINTIDNVGINKLDIDILSAKILDSELSLEDELELHNESIDREIELEMEERRVIHRQIMRSLELDREIDEQERIRLQYMLIQLEAQLRMNPESIKEDLRYFSMMNNIDCPSSEKMDVMIEKANDKHRPLTSCQEKSISSWFNSVPEMFLNPISGIYDEIRSLSDESLNIIYEKTQLNPYFGELKEVNLDNYKNWTMVDELNPLDIHSWSDISNIMPEISKINGVEDWIMPPFPLKSTDEINNYIEYLRNPEDVSFDYYFTGYTGDEIDKIS